MPSPYALDTTGVLAANKVTNETHVITAVNASAYHIVLPDQAPFFESGLIVRHTSTLGVQRTLVYGVDYHPSHRFDGASKATAKPVWGSISLMDLSLAGMVTITYQCLGGNWGGTPIQIMENLANMARNPRTTTWEQIANLPAVFPPVDHQWNLDDLVGMSEVVGSLDALATAVAVKAVEAEEATQDPVPTKRMIGLENLDNFKTATEAEAVAGSSATRFMTPYGVKRAMEYRLTQFTLTVQQDMINQAAKANLTATLTPSGLTVSNTNGTGFGLGLTTSSAAGLLSPALMEKLNGISALANRVIVEDVLTSSSTVNAVSARQAAQLKATIDAFNSQLLQLNTAVVTNGIQIDSLLDEFQAGQIGIVDNLLDTASNKALSAKQGNILNSSLSQMSSQVTTLVDNMTRLLTAEGAQDTAISANQISNTNLNGQVTTINASLQSLTGNLNTVTTTVNSHTSSIGTLTANYTSLNTRANSQDTAITALNATVGGHNTNIAGLTSAVSTLQTSSTSYSTSINTLTTNLTTVSGTVGAHTTSINTLNGNYTTLLNSYNNLSATVGQHATAVAALQATVAQHTAAMSTYVILKVTTASVAPSSGMQVGDRWFKPDGAGSYLRYDWNGAIWQEYGGAAGGGAVINSSDYVRVYRTDTNPVLNVANTVNVGDTWITTAAIRSWWTGTTWVEY